MKLLTSSLVVLVCAAIGLLAGGLVGYVAERQSPLWTHMYTLFGCLSGAGIGLVVGAFILMLRAAPGPQ